MLSGNLNLFIPALLYNIFKPFLLVGSFGASRGRGAAPGRGGGGGGGGNSNSKPRGK